MSEFRAALRLHHKVAALVTALTVPASLAEGAAIVPIASVATQLASPDDPTSLPLGISWDPTTETLVVVAAVLVIAGTALRLLVTRIRAHAAAEYEFELRRDLAASYFHADHPTQRGINKGEVMELAGGAASRAGTRVVATTQAVTSGCSLLLFITGAIIVQATVGLMLVGRGVVAILGLRPLTQAVRRSAERATNANIVQSP